MTDRDIQQPVPTSTSTAATDAPPGTNPTNSKPPPSSIAENGTPAAARPPYALRSLNVSNSPSTSSSPLSSRDPSPARPTPRQPAMSGTALPKRSRKHSTDTSPNRPPSLPNVGATPSAAAIQRALSSTTTPQLKPTPAEESGRNVRSQKGSDPSSGENTPRWPVSPRLKSPPPSGTRSRKNSLNSLRSQVRNQSPSQGVSKKTENTATTVAPSITVQSSTPPSKATAQRASVKNEQVLSDSDDQAPLTMKSASRAASGAPRTLETVQEGSLPNTPGFELAQAQSLQSISEASAASSDAASESSSRTITDASRDKSAGASATESGSDSGENRMEEPAKPIVQKAATAPRTTIPSRSSFTTLAPTKSRTVNEAKNMIVETETVPSVPQPTIGTQGERSGQGRSDPSGTLRMKPSSETIRPKKAKKPARKAPSINSGTASSKADIFEAKVASAQDEANSSDSDETFVYESNPPDSQSRTGFHHSRTPSVTSITSLENSRLNVRSIGNVLDSQRHVPSKRSMKFASNTYNSHNADYDPNDRGEGTVRIGGGRGGGSSVHHHHIGRHGRGPPSILDSDSPFPQSAKGRASRQGSRPNSPRQANHPMRFANGPTKQNSELSMYDMAGEAADDERTPLMGNRALRGPRTPRSVRAINAVQHYEHFQRQQDSWLRRFAGCIVLTVMMVLLIAGAVGFLFATTKPLYQVHIKSLRNVLASEQELMLDLVVEAVNPNVISVTVSDMDVNLFAKSKHVGSDKWWREHAPHSHLDDLIGPRNIQQRVSQRASTERDTFHSAGNKDEGSDPIPDPSGDSTTMLLGRIFQFDSSLVFEGSPLKRVAHSSVGEVRYNKPGNKTEMGGTERWERVILYPFELIVRGVLKYQLPLSSHTHTAAIGYSIIVHPEKGVNSGGQMHIESIEHHNAHGGGDLFSETDWPDDEEIPPVLNPELL